MTTAYCLCAVPAKISVYLPYKILGMHFRPISPPSLRKTVSALARPTLLQWNIDPLNSDIVINFSNKVALPVHLS